VSLKGAFDNNRLRFLAVDGNQDSWQGGRINPGGLPPVYQEVTSTPHPEATVSKNILRLSG
jgi:hypothetical protein